MIEERIGIIGGNGWLGNAIAHALTSRGALHPARLMISGRSRPRGAKEIEGARFTHDNAELAAWSDVIILSVPPALFHEVRIDAAHKLVVSVMAGIRSDAIAAQTGSARIVRAMPNAAAVLGQSFTPWFARDAVTGKDKRLVQTVFESCGEAAEVPQEDHVDYCTGMTGAGAAFPALLAEALVADAVRQGLPEEFARRAARGVVAGASQLFAGERGDTAAIVKEMIDYRGTTAAALQAMLARGFNEAVAAGLAAAAAKARSMG